ncbi:hypothetical protein GCM10022287_21970 [Gryllotalpicola koreensis]|uniref:Uncharacterized protein n=1 Tax=Gryllotalpicola koreensis TaxID=993086 RepID=A0ABP8A216_9MICO
MADIGIVAVDSPLAPEQVLAELGRALGKPVVNGEVKLSPFQSIDADAEDLGDGFNITLGVWDGRGQREANAAAVAIAADLKQRGMRAEFQPL